MRKLYEYLLERIEYYGAKFFNSVTPGFLDHPDLDFEKVSYQLFIGVVILALIAWFVVWYVDRLAEKNKTRENRLIKFSWKNIEDIYHNDGISESALEVMLRRQEEQIKAAQEIRSGTTAQTKKERHVYGVDQNSLPTFFRG